MANVLIGIIGVILFIGLALAAVLFLGPQFQQASNNSKGSAALQAVAQIAQAANLAYEQSGTPTGTGTGTATDVGNLVTGNYLKTVPSNPITPANYPNLMTTAGVVAAGSTANVAAMDVGTGASADAICLQVQIQTNQQPSTATTVASATAFPTTPVSGCLKASATSGGLTLAHDYVFTNI